MQEIELSRETDSSSVRQLRVVLEVDDLDRAVAFYRDALGLEQLVSYENGDARLVLLEAGRATLELANSAQARMIDEIEVGHIVGAKVRLAFQVPDTAARTLALMEAGATLVASPVLTPWRSLNTRLESPDHIQLTLFQELDDEESWNGPGQSPA